jgi:DnaJ-class molecular chaperone
MNLGPEQAEALELGLAKLPDDFRFKLCEVCKGHGRYRQTYTAGCGFGSYESMGSCDYCHSKGLVHMHHRNVAAPESVYNQVIEAGTR